MNFAASAEPCLIDITREKPSIIRDFIATYGVISANDENSLSCVTNALPHVFLFCISFEGSVERQGAEAAAIVFSSSFFYP